MNPITHYLVSWVVADSSNLDKRERAAVTLSGVIPDIDSFGIIAEQLTKESERPLLWWSDCHHVFGHNIGFGILVAVIVFIIAKKKWKVMILALFCFHLHLLCDIIGAKGPDGYQWPIPYLIPFSNAIQIVWKYQWEINAWPNFVITITTLVITFYYAWKHGYSALEIISKNIDRVFVRTLQNRFGKQI
jgi:membrane-bound metal-dependent hydrolase YbcI (DUF457 family)